MSGVLPAPLIILSTFVGYVAGGLGGGVAMTLGTFLPAFPDLLSPRARRNRRGPAHQAVPARLGRWRHRADRGGYRRHREHERRRRVDRCARCRRVRGTHRWHGKLTIVAVVLGCGAVGALLQVSGVV
jgi:hypothetical protein